MSIETWVWLGAVVFSIVFTTGFGMWAKRRPNLDKVTKGAVRQPKVIPIFGWILLVAGALLFLLSIPLIMESSAGIGPLASGAGMMAFGGVFLLIYKNWYVLVGPDEIVNRSVFGKIKRIRYDSIRRYSFTTNGVVPMVNVWGLDGVGISVNSSAFNVDPLLDVLEHHLHHGVWPHEVAGSGDYYGDKR